MWIKMKVLLGVLVFGMILGGATLKASASELSFGVKPIPPENQINNQVSYFNIRLEPSQTQTLEIELTNDTQRVVTVVPQIATATTNYHGVVEYGPRDIEYDSTLPFRMEDLVTVPEEVTIAPESSTRLEIEVKMPEASFDGILAGGITLEEKLSEAEIETNSEKTGMCIKNQFSYVIAILLRNNENEVVPEIQLNEIFPSQINKRNVIKANIQNRKPMYMNQMSVLAKITEKGSDKILFESTSEGLQMAPNSNLDYPIGLDGMPLRKGEYILDLTVNSMGETWHWTESFTIHKDEAKNLNSKDVNIQRNYLQLERQIGLAFSGFAVFVIILFYRKQSKNEE